MQVIRHILDLLWTELSAVVSVSIVRLILAAVLGGMIGLEREIHHKPAGLRTNLFICFGSAMFTILSAELADVYGGDHTRIAAQIIPGIGFIGAGSILHARGSVTGLTTAATLFVVASVGMAAGGGLYVTAIFATFVILVALALLGKLERSFELKSVQISYEVIGGSVDGVINELNRILGELGKRMQDLQVQSVDGQYRVEFGVTGSRSEHDRLSARLRQSTVFSSITSLGTPEHE
jgi:putative Mg2+ transporter-C (MgtC) family protein